MREEGSCWGTKQQRAPSRPWSLHALPDAHTARLSSCSKGPEAAGSAASARIFEWRTTLDRHKNKEEFGQKFSLRTLKLLAHSWRSAKPVYRVFSLGVLKNRDTA